MRELAELKREIGRLQRGRGRRYPAALRARIASYAAKRRAEGETWASLRDELGVPWETLRRWSIDGPRASVVPVEVIAPSPDRGDEVVAVVSPTGWRLEGLAVRDAVAVLRALS